MHCSNLQDIVWMLICLHTDHECDEEMLMIFSKDSFKGGHRIPCTFMVAHQLP